MKKLIWFYKIIQNHIEKGKIKKHYKNKKNIEKSWKKKINKLNKQEKQNKISELNNSPFNNFKAYLEGVKLRNLRGIWVIFS